MAQQPLHSALVSICATQREPLNAIAPEVARANYALNRKNTDAPAPAMATRDFEIAGPSIDLRARLYQPARRDKQNSPLLIFFHGGGWFLGSIDTHDSICRMLAATARCVVLSVDYRLAPEHHFPAAVHDAYAALRWATENAVRMGADPHKIAVGGDSAGGNIAAGLTLLARERRGPYIAQQFLLYPATDLAGLHQSRQLFGKGYVLEDMDFYISNYLGPDGDPRHYLASPLLASDLSGLPPAYVLTAGYDPLRDEGQAYARRLLAAGVRVRHECAANMIHGFIGQRKLLAEADEALRNCAKALAEGFGCTGIP